MDYYSNQISRLIEELSHLPGIGAKSAARLAFHLIHMPEDDVKRLADTMVSARQNVRYCSECCTLTDQELCPICSNSDRDLHQLHYHFRRLQYSGPHHHHMQILHLIDCLLHISEALQYV